MKFLGKRSEMWNFSNPSELQNIARGKNTKSTILPMEGLVPTIRNRKEGKKKVFRKRYCGFIQITTPTAATRLQGQRWSGQGCRQTAPAARHVSPGNRLALGSAH